MTASPTRSRRHTSSAIRPVIEQVEKRLLFATVPLLDPLTQPKFVNPLPLPGYVQPDSAGGTSYTVNVTQQQQQLGLYNPKNGKPLTTTVWGYNGSYPGPTFNVQKGTPIDVTWNNTLVGKNGKPLPHLLPVDTSIHWAYGDHGTSHYTIQNDGVPIVTHLHGGHVEADSDGGPDAWYNPSGTAVGPAYVKKTYTYANDQDAATLWYHDHALGITRLNVYAGLAGYYYLRDNLDTGVPDDPATKNVDENPLGLPTGKYEIPLAIQDRMFTANGALYIPSRLDEFYTPEEIAELDPNTPQTSILPEFLGDHILVNGKAWPFLEVEPRKYRFRMLNGSDSRFYTLTLPGGPGFLQIGTDQGLLERGVASNELTFGPGERLDVIIDFAGFKGQTLTLRNSANTPFPNGDPVNPLTTGQIMAFKVGSKVTEAEPRLASRFVNIRPVKPQQADFTRQLGLFEMTDKYGRLLPSLGTVTDGALAWDDPTTEIIRLGDTEVWEIYNTTMDAHPIHLHLVKFQVINRQNFTADVDMDTGKISNIALAGGAVAPTGGDAGWKDTVIMMPGQVTRIIATFDKPGGYVWHCHILSHEDHEMMRRLEVVEPTLAAELFATSASRSAGTTFSDISIDADEEDLLATL